MYVYYPHGGEHFMLTHWTHNEQTHIVLGRTPEACLAVVNPTKFVKDDYPEVRTFERITIVQPTLEFQYKVQVRNAVKEREEFKDYVVFLAKEHLTLTGKFPPGFSECPKYVARYENEDYTEAKDEDHFGCAVCQSKVVVNRVTVLALYAEALRRKSNDDHWRTGLPGRGQTRSRALYADPARDLFEMVSNPGHHCSGTGGNLALPEWSGHNVLFYYHKDEPLPEWLARAQKSVGDRRAEYERVRKSEESEWHRRASERNRQRRIEVMTFFGTKE